MHFYSSYYFTTLHKERLYDATHRTINLISINTSRFYTKHHSATSYQLCITLPSTYLKFPCEQPFAHLYFPRPRLPKGTMPASSLFQLAKKGCAKNIRGRSTTCDPNMTTRLFSIAIVDIGDIPYPIIRPVLMLLENPEQLVSDDLP